MEIFEFKPSGKGQQLRCIFEAMRISQGFLLEIFDSKKFLMAARQSVAELAWSAISRFDAKSAGQRILSGRLCIASREAILRNNSEKKYTYSSRISKFQEALLLC